MKFLENDVVFYVNPICFYIEKVKIGLSVKDHTGTFYIDHSGAYLAEHDVFKTLEEAKGQMFKYLNKYYEDKLKSLITLQEHHLKVEEL